ncbi:MAG: DUF2974 domain-containing protein [Lancefieldella parvula]|uniref:DUF2974 domain-containing protein n=1 Tax=Lancefieldella parvula TaxID=1382 RepID=A0A930YSJ4_9ACTN|nr:DUF2974 domain-containing protein [Lancefieldella parvula]
MANVVDYLHWRGDLTFEKDPFNNVDNLILSILSYLGFGGVVPSERSEKRVQLGDACAKMLEKLKDDPSLITGFSRVDGTFLEALVNAPRFANIELGRYVDRINVEKNLQFAAFTAYLPTGQMFVSFRGTDGTLVGWRENLNLSFQVTSADKSAALYLEKRIREHLAEGNSSTCANVMVGGHSKGGNLASYAATVCPEELLGTLERVWSNDGPNMCPEILPATAHKVLGDKYIRILPEFSVVGMIFDDPAVPKLIVKSSESGMLAHDGVSWQVSRNTFEFADDFQLECKKINEAFSNWYKELPLSDREHFTNELFDALSAGGAVYFSDIISSPANLQPVVAALTKTEKQTKEVFFDLLSSLVNASATSLIENITESSQISQLTSAISESFAKLDKAQKELTKGSPSSDQ